MRLQTPWQQYQHKHNPYVTSLVAKPCNPLSSVLALVFSLRKLTTQHAQIVRAVSSTAPAIMCCNSSLMRVRGSEAYSQTKPKNLFLFLPTPPSQFGFLLQPIVPVILTRWETRLKSISGYVYQLLVTGTPLSMLSNPGEKKQACSISRCSVFVLTSLSPTYCSLGRTLLSCARVLSLSLTLCLARSCSTFPSVFLLY